MTENVPTMGVANIVHTVPGVYVCACVCVYMCACMRACVRLLCHRTYTVYVHYKPAMLSSLDYLKMAEANLDLQE